MRTARRRRPAWMAVLLAAPLLLPLGTAMAAGNAAPPGARGGAVRPAPSQMAASTPRLPDSPQELLPAVETGVAPRSPQAACLAAARRAEAVHGLPSGLLVAIALSESGLHAHALNIGGRSYFPQDFATARALMLGAAPGRSVMAGCVQVNARVHARGADWPLDPVRSADWAGGMLRRWYSETGSWAEALRRWHGGSLASTRRVMCRVRAKLEVTAPGSNALPEAGCSQVEIARVRRSGAALLEVAEAP